MHPLRIHRDRQSRLQRCNKRLRALGVEYPLQSPRSRGQVLFAAAQQPFQRRDLPRHGLGAKLRLRDPLPHRAAALLCDPLPLLTLGLRPQACTLPLLLGGQPLRLGLRLLLCPRLGLGGALFLPLALRLLLLRLCYGPPLLRLPGPAGAILQLLSGTLVLLVLGIHLRQ